MKTMIRLVLLVMLMGSLLPCIPAAKGQTLGEVLRAVQNRKKLTEEKKNVNIDLWNQGTGEGAPWADQRLPSYQVKLIDWGVVSESPSDAEVNGLAVGDQVKLLRQAWQELDKLGGEFLESRKFSSGVGSFSSVQFEEQEVRITPENFGEILQVLAKKVSRMNAIHCASDWNSFPGGGDGQTDLTSLPSPMTIGGNLDLTPPTPWPWAVGEDGWADFEFLGNYADGQNGGSDPTKYGYSTAKQPPCVQVLAPDSFPGRIQIFSDLDYSVNSIEGLTWPSAPGGDGDPRTLYHPGNQRLKDVAIEAGASLFIGQLPGVFGGDSSSLSFPGTWSGVVFLPTYQNQNNATLWTSFYNSNPYAMSSDFWNWIFWNPRGATHHLECSSVFVADYGQEFTSQPAAVPEKAPPLQIIPDLGNGRLKIRLANEPANDCELDWVFPATILLGNSHDYSPGLGALSARNILNVRGCGDWDAVYSGKPEDREEEIVWAGDRFQTNGRWANFDNYVKEWWKPVLKQLVTAKPGKKAATYGLNITQQGRYKYQIDFYYAGQIGTKDTHTGTYAFTGSPADTFVVENPQGDDAKAGLLQITVHNGKPNQGIYNVTLTQPTNSKVWELTGTQGSHTFLHKTVTVTAEGYATTGPRNITQPYKVVDSTSVDGVALPQVTTTYWDTWANPQHIEKVVEEGGSEGTRTTEYTYAKDTDANGLQTINHLTDIVQTEGINPYTASYDENELLTDYTCGASEVQVGYSGATVTRTEQFQDHTVKVLATTYSNGMTRAETTASGVSGAVTALTEYNDPEDTVNPWGIKTERGFDGTVSTYQYSWSGDTFVTEIRSGRGSSSTAETVSAGTRTVAKVNTSGWLTSNEVFDIRSGAKIDFATSTVVQAGTQFPTPFTGPLGTTESYHYDNNGQVLTYTDRLGKVTTYTYDALGRVTLAVRAGVTTTTEYNKNGLGQTVTVTGADTRTREETTTPFGGTQTVAITGPEIITTTRTETTGTITTTTNNTTTGSISTVTVDKGTMATDVSGNASEPVHTVYEFPGNGTKTTTTVGGTGSGVQTITSSDALGRVTQTQSPSPSGSGTATTNYSYSGGQLISSSGPEGTTLYEYEPEGTLSKSSRGGRFQSMQRVTSSTSQIKWQWTDAGDGALWERIWYPDTGVVEDYPWGNPLRKITKTPSISGDVETVVTLGSGINAQSSTKDGVPQQGYTQMGAARQAWSAATNTYGELTSQTSATGTTTAAGATNSVTTGYSLLGLPTTTSGLISATYQNSFSGGAQTFSMTRNNTHVQTAIISPKGNVTSDGGYAKPDATITEPSYGSTIQQTLSTGTGTSTLPTNFTRNLAGQLQERKFPDNTAETFAYNAAGAMTSQTTPRATLSFTPNAFGEPTTIGSSGSLGYNERGEVNAQSTASDTSSLEYYHGQVSKEEHTAGVLAGQTLIREYDEHDRLKTIKLPGDVSISYTYNDDCTLNTVTTAGGVGGTWSNYDTITGKAKDFTLGPLSSSNVFDGLKRITSHTNSAAGSSYAYGYHYDADGHCDTRTTPEESWTFGYDSGTGYLFHATSSAGESFTYDFDDSGRHSGSVDYRPQVRINGTAVNIFGSVAPTASVTINNTAVTVNSTTGLFNQAVSPTAGWNQYTVKGTLVNGGYNGQSNAVAEKSYLVYLPPTSESLGYDLSGNRNGDARWTQTWNELDQMTSAVENNPAPGVAAMSLNFAYDVGGRRVETQVYSGATLIQRVTTLWDGWLPAMDIEYDGSGAETDRRYYTWGPDVSGRMGGAGGIGGLLEIDERRGSTEFRSLPMNDGIGNVIGSVDGSTGERVATYQYGPFGEVVNVSGERASSCPFRYQSKRYEEQTGTYYFGKRYYEPKTQTWWSRDPQREDGGINLYAYCQNDPVGNFDPVGLGLLSTIFGTEDMGEFAGNYASAWYEHEDDDVDNFFAGVGEGSVSLGQSVQQLATHPIDSGGAMVSGTYHGLVSVGNSLGSTAYQAYADPTHIYDNALNGVNSALNGIDPNHVSKGIGKALPGTEAAIVTGPLVGKVAKALPSVTKIIASPMLLRSQAGAIDIFGSKLTKSAGRKALVESEIGSGKAYSVGYEMKMEIPKIPKGTRDSHFRIANEDLFSQMDSNPEFAQMMEKMIPEINTVRGTAKAPKNWVWNHSALNPGVMQLVPSIQHWSPNPLWSLFHPPLDGVHSGGFKRWGYLY